MRWFVAALGLLCVGCSSPDYHPAGPSGVIPPLASTFSATGRWDGVVQITVNGERAQASTVFLLNQSSANTITGRWSAQAITAPDARGRVIAVGQDVGGTFSGARSENGAYSGTIVWDGASSTPTTRCSGSAPFVGALQREGLTMTAPSLGLGPCGSITNVTWLAGPSIGTIR